MKDDKKLYPTPGLKKSISELDELLSRNSEYPILIQGPTGSGKTFFYERIIDYFIDKKNNPNLPYKLINCAAIPEELIESELFGHEKGAFTGATKSKIGLLEVADKGVAVLDEIGELSETLQAKLLTFFDTKKITRVGSTKEVHVDVFIVGTTNASEKKFRKDFWHRFNKITVPPLYERRKDILYLMRQFCGTTPIIGWQLLDCLCQTWDGNVRELNIEYHHYTKKEGLAETDELSSNPPNFGFFDFVSIREFLGKDLPLPLYLLKYPPFNRIADRLQKKFPTLFGTNALDLSKFNDKRLEGLYREFLLFCWHFHQHPYLNDNILENITKSEPTQSSHVYGTADPGCDFDLKMDIVKIYDQNPEAFGSSQIDQSEPPPEERLSEPEPPPINHCDMKKVSPNDYYQLWLLYHLYILKRSQSDIAKEFNIPTSTISRWVKKKLSPDTLKKLGSI